MCVCACVCACVCVCVRVCVCVCVCASNTFPGGTDPQFLIMTSQVLLVTSHCHSKHHSSITLTNCFTGITPNQLTIDRSLYQLGDRSPILMATSDYLPVIQILKKWEPQTAVSLLFELLSVVHPVHQSAQSRLDCKPPSSSLIMKTTSIHLCVGMIG